MGIYYQRHPRLEFKGSTEIKMKTGNGDANVRVAVDY